MRRQRRRTSAFTLVEILIVVVILGILAAIVVPQFTNATQDAQAGNIQAQLDTLNNQLELYRARENEYPDIAASWDVMIDGGYVKSNPVNPFNGENSVGDDPDANGWHLGVDLNGDGDEADPGEATTLGATNYDEFNKVITPGVK